MKGKRLAIAMSLMIPLLLATAAVAKDYVIKKPPASLEQFYPPKSKELKWVDNMHKFSNHFGGIFVDMRESDWPNAEKHAAELLDVYTETAKMVPEWKDYFDVEAVKKMTEAVKTHDAKQIGEAAKPIGKTCHKCHEEQYVAVWTRFSWPAQSSLKLVDPVEEKEVSYEKFMGIMTGAYNGIMVNFGESQYDRAAKSAGAFKKRLTELKSVCSKCHVGDAVKQFFIGEPVMQAVDNVIKELGAEKPNPGTFWQNIGTISAQSCKMCHLTHRSAAIIQEVWEDK